MEITQTNKLKMTQATLGCLQDNAAACADIEGIQEATDEAQTLVDAIVERSLKQSAATGLTSFKSGVRQAMLAAAFKVCSGLTSLASKTQDTKLAAQANFSRTGLASGREQDVINRCQTLLDLGTANAAPLAAKYNVTANDLKALKTAIADFTAAQPKPRLGISASASATAELVDLFAQLDEVLNRQPDPLMETLASVNPSFYNEYQTARTIVDSSASHVAKTAPVTPPAALAATA